MIYHRFRLSYFGLNNFKNALCRIFGHRLNENPAHHWCERCGLEYGECYKPLDYWTASGISQTEEADKKSSIHFAQWTVQAYPFPDTKIIEGNPIAARSDKFGNKYTYEDLFKIYHQTPNNK